MVSQSKSSPIPHEIDLKIRLKPKQHQFVFNRYYESCYGGGIRSGKTFAACLRALLLSLNFPHNRGIIGRQTYKDLRETTMTTFFDKVMPPDLMKACYWNEERKLLRLPAPWYSDILFRHVDDLTEAGLRGMELGWFFLDQAEESRGELIYLTLLSRLSLTDVPRQYAFVTANPAGRNWVWRRFVRDRDSGERLLIEGTPWDVEEYLPKDYIQLQMREHPDTWVERYIKGNWDTIEGQIFSEFNERVHVIEPFDAPEDKAIYIGMDHGSANPSAFEWAFQDDDKNLIYFDEHYEGNLTPQQHTEIVKAKCLRPPKAIIGDPAIRYRTAQNNKGEMISVQQLYQNAGLNILTPGVGVVGRTSSKDARILLAQQLFHVNPNRLNHYTGEMGSPQVFIMRGKCPNLQAEILEYHRARARIGDSGELQSEEPEDVFDHAIDAHLYLVNFLYGGLQRLLDKPPQQELMLRR